MSATSCNLDQLPTQRVAIEAALAEREKTLFGLDQTVFLYAVNRDGFPLAHEVFAGNRHDSTTLDEMTALDQRVGLHAGQTVVVDRGMSGKENLQNKAKKLHCLVAEPYGARSDWVEEFENDEGFGR